MLIVDKTTIYGWQEAIRGMRNPMNSWDKSDTTYHPDPVIGGNDMKLMRSLITAGSADRKFLRMIVCYMDITAPIYWWKEYDTYKVGTVANSCSTMHKIHSRPLTEADFSSEHLDEYSLLAFGNIIDRINECRDEYIASGKKDKNTWYQLIQLLPSSYMQTRTCMVSYEVLRKMYHERKNHKLNEWRVDFCNWVRSLPYAKELISDE